MELDPLLALAALIAGRTLQVGLLLSLVVLVLTFVFGRSWCGWICPVGTTLDIFRFRRISKKIGISIPDSLRKIKFILLTVILSAALFGNLSLLILDPMTLWVRTLTGGIGPALNFGFTALERALANIPWLVPSLMKLDAIVRPTIFPLEAIGVRLVWLPLLLFGILIFLNLLAERFWCRYLCPLGGLLGWISRIALVKRTVESGCTKCGKCERLCPTGTIDPARNYSSDPAECTLCMDCLEACPTSQIGFHVGRVPPEKMQYDLGRREFMVSGGAALMGLALLETEKLTRPTPFNLLRPPGVLTDEFLDKCLRCGLCVRACPTGALQPAIKEAGIGGLFTPVLIPRLGYCLYTCNDCGQVCPTGAIPALSLEQKQTQVIGIAVIDQNRCLPWADGISCIVCEEMCPLPDKAITLEIKELVNPDGTISRLQLPRVHRKKCIGCGICENKCPVERNAAIQVFKGNRFGRAQAK
jgi:MauM/NapG family ferredoxin protein